MGGLSRTDRLDRKDRARRGGVDRRRRRGRQLKGPHLGLAGAALALGCARNAPPPPPASPPPPPLTEESLAPSTTAEFQIGPIKETPSADGSAVFVEGAVRNVGSRPSRDVQVTVEGLDAAGTPVVSAVTLPAPQTIAPDGSATFVVRLPNDRTVRTYHVVAIGR